MTQEQLRMQMLAGIITEGQYKEKLNEIKINKPGFKKKDYIIKDEIDDDGDPVEPYIATHLFLEYLYNLLSQAGYKIPEDFEEAIEAQAYDTDIAYLDNDDPESLDYFENFNLQDAIDMVNEILEDWGDWEYDSIEDFKV